MSASARRRTSLFGLPLARPLATLRSDFEAVLERDPASRGLLEALLCYPGLHALWGYRLAHGLWKRDAKLLGRLVSHLVRWLTGIEIHPGAQIGPGLFIDHGMGVVIGETCEIGANVTLYHGVTLGGVSTARGKRHPTLRDDVVVGAGAKILGAIEIGAGSRIGANAVVVKAVPPNSVVVGVPGQVILRSGPAAAQRGPDLEHGQLPDTLGAALRGLRERVEQLERRAGLTDGAAGAAPEPAGPKPVAQTFWRGEDFSI